MKVGDERLARDLVTILRTEAKNQRTPPIDYVIAEDGGRMVHTPEPDIAMAELLEEAASALARRDMQLEASAKVALDLSAQLAEARKALAALDRTRKALAALDRMSRGVDWCDQDEQARRWSAARRVLKLGEHKDEASAIAAAQADYERRILSALSVKEPANAD